MKTGDYFTSIAAKNDLTWLQATSMKFLSRMRREEERGWMLEQLISFIA